MKPLTDGARIEAALRALGYGVVRDEYRVLAGDPNRQTLIRFYREDDGVYSVTGDKSNLDAILRKYEELVVRKQRKGKEDG